MVNILITDGIVIPTDDRYTIEDYLADQPVPEGALGHVRVRTYSKAVDTSLELSISIKKSITQCFHAALSDLHRYPWFGLYNLFLSVSHGPWQDDNRITRYYKLWKREPWAKDLSHSVLDTPEVLVSSEHGLRYSGCVTISESDIDVIVKNNYPYHPIFVFAKRVSNSLSVDEIKSLFDAAFPEKSTDVNWISLIKNLCPKGYLIFRTHGCFDDVEVSVDVFYSTDLDL